MNDKTPNRPDWLAALLLRPDSTLSLKVAAGAARLAALPRGLRRRVRRGLPGLAGIGMLLALGGSLLMARPSVFAAGIVVDGVTCDLPSAVKAANTDTAVGGCAAGSGDDLITLTADVLLTTPFSDALGEPTGLPLISVSNITIEGNGHTIARDANADPFRILALSRGGLTLKDVTLSGGSAATGGAIRADRSTIILDNVILSDNTADDSGGAIYQLRGTTEIIDSALSGNSAPNGGAIYSYTGGLTITASQVTGNTAEYGSGGALYLSYESVVTVSGSTFSGNSSATGGAIFSGYSTLDIVNSTISGNSADNGGGLYTSYGLVSIHTSTLSDNTATYNGGAAYSFSTPLAISRCTFSGNSASYGGGIYNTGIVFDGLSVVNSTFSGNTAVYGGGLASSGTAELINTTLTANTASQNGGGVFNFDGVLTLERTLISGNSAGVTGAEIALDGGATNSNGSSVFSHEGLTSVDALTSFAPDPTDIDGSSDAANIALATILDATLAANGGPTQTHALPPGSPAIDLGSSVSCAAAPVGGVDQRGQPRPLDGDELPGAEDCDAGAFEYDPTPPTATPTATLAPSATVTGTPPTEVPTVTGTPTATPSTVTPSPTATVDVTLTPSVTPTASPSPTATASPTASPSATPDAWPTPTIAPGGYTIYLPSLISPDP